MEERGSQREGDGSALVDDRSPSRPYHWNYRPHGVLQALGRACHLGGSVNGPVSNAGALPRSHHANCSATSVASCLRSAHSQTVATRQPAWSRSCRLRRSRSVFASNFARQNSGRVVGMVVYGQPACRCQKQPCTRHTAPNRRNTRSGVPGSLRSCRRYRSPRAWIARRRASSGRVFLLPIPRHHARTSCAVHDVCHRRSCTTLGGGRQTRGYTRGPGCDATRRDVATTY